MIIFKRCSKVMFYGVLILLFTATQSMAKPTSGAFAAATKSVAKDASGTTAKPASKTIRAKKDNRLADLPQLSITYFKKAVPGGTFLAPSAMGSSSSAPAPSIDLGDEIELAWSITYKNVRTPRVTIDGQVVTGEAHTASDGTPWMAGTKTFRPAGTKTYNIVVTAAPEHGGRGLRTQKSLQVTVKKPELTVLEPEVNQNNLTIKFFAKNTGDAVFRPTPINVNYEIDGGSLARGNFATPRVEIAKNQTVELGQITLPDRNRAFQNDSIRIRVNIGAYYVQPLREARGDFTHRWTTQTVRIDNSMLNLLGMGTVCEVMIDNWNESHGSGRAITPPHQENASFVDFNVFENHQRMQFTLPHIEHVSTGGPLGLRYWTYLKNIRAYSRGDSALFSISEGKLQISLEFPNTDSREIKIGRIGNVGGYDGKWIDDDAPDVNLSSFTVNIKFAPAVSGGQLTYTNVDVQIEGLSASFPGGWSWLNPGFQSYITRVVRRNLDSALTSILTNDSIRNSIIGGINSGISVTGASITRIMSVSGSGSALTVEYL